MVLTEKGFQRPTYDDLLDRQGPLSQSRFWFLVAVRSSMGRMITVLVPMEPGKPGLPVQRREPAEICGNLPLHTDLSIINPSPDLSLVELLEIETYIHKVHDIVNVQKLEISGDGVSYGTDNVLAGDYEIARTAAEKIEIEVVT